MEVRHAGLIVWTVFILLVAALAVLLIAGSHKPSLQNRPVGSVNVTSVFLVAEGPNSSATTRLPGFASYTGYAITYNISVSNLNYTNMSLGGVRVGGSNFSLASYSPRLPENVGYNSTRTLDLSLRMPNKTYQGALYIYYNYTPSRIGFHSAASERVSVLPNESLLVSVSSGKPASVSVLTPQEYGALESNASHGSVLSYRTSGASNSMLIQGNLSGEYYLVAEANSVALNLSYLTLPKGRWMAITGNQTYGLSLSNFSVVSIDAASTSPDNLYLYNNFDNSSVLLFRLGYTNASERMENSFYTNRGSYVVRLAPGSNGYALISLNSTPVLINPFYNLYQSGFPSPIPVGIASYGLYDNLSDSSGYQISTNEVVGTANISRMYICGFAYGCSASMQLNVVTRLDSGGESRTYWLQDVATFNTNNRTFNFEDNIWNLTAASSNINPETLHGNGYIASLQSNPYGLGSNWYYDGLNYAGYSMPLNITLVVKEYQSGKNVVVAFGYQVRNDTSGATRPPVFYDNVTIYNSENGSIIVTPYYYTPVSLKYRLGIYYDAELIFGGQGDGESAQFGEFNASLGLYYYDNGLREFPSVYTFGRNTAEGTDNLLSTPYRNTGYVTVGEVNPLSGIAAGQTSDILSLEKYPVIT